MECQHLPLKPRVVNKSRSASVVPFVIVTFDGSEVAIGVHIIREYKLSRACIVFEVGRRRRRENSNQHRRAGGSEFRLVVDLQGVQLQLVSVLILDSVGYSASIKPECFASFSQRDLEGRSRGRESCDIDRLFGSTAGEPRFTKSKCQHLLLLFEIVLAEWYDYQISCGIGDS